MSSSRREALACGLRWRKCDADVSGSADGNTAVGRELRRLHLRGWAAENGEAIKAPRGHLWPPAFVGPLREAEKKKSKCPGFGGQAEKEKQV